MQKPVPIPGTCLALLRQMLQPGATLHSDRTYPFERKYWLTRLTVTKDGRSQTSARSVPASTIAGLIEGGYLTATAQSPTADTITYGATSKGVLLATDGLFYEDGQPDLFPQCVENDVNKLDHRKDAIRGGQ